VEKVSVLGMATAKYHHHGETPHSALLFSTVLKKSTSPSGHNQRCQKKLSTTTLNAGDTMSTMIMSF